MPLKPWQGPTKRIQNGWSFYYEAVGWQMRTAVNHLSVGRSEAQPGLDATAPCIQSPAATYCRLLKPNANDLLSRGEYLLSVGKHSANRAADNYCTVCRPTRQSDIPVQVFEGTG